MQFTNPIFLWALTGLSIPIGIHLLSRKEGKVIRLGSLRHVHETSTQQFRGIRLNEVLLLILRCLLVVLFTLIISGLHWNGLGKKKWLLVEKGLEHDAPLQAIIDSLTEEGYEPRLLADDFPPLEDSTNVSPINYWGLLEDLKAKNLSDVIVFAQNRVDHFNGFRVALPAHVRWISQALPPSEFELQTVALSDDSVLVRKGYADDAVTSFTSQKMSKSGGTTQIELRDTIRLAIVGDKKYEYDHKIMKAAVNAIRKSLPVEIELRDIAPGNPFPDLDWLIWLSDESIPTTDTKTLQLKPTAHQLNLLIRESNQAWVITRRLNEDVALQENLTLTLAALLVPNDALSFKAKTYDRRKVIDSIAWGGQTEITALEARTVEPADRYLIVLLIVMLCVERIVAYRRNQ